MHLVEEVAVRAARQDDIALVSGRRFHHHRAVRVGQVERPVHHGARKDEAVRARERRLFYVVVRVRAEEVAGPLVIGQDPFALLHVNGRFRCERHGVADA